MVRALVGAEALRVGGFLRPGQWDLRVECGGPESEVSCAQVSGSIPQGRVWGRRFPAPRSVGSQGGVWGRRFPAPRSVGPSPKVECGVGGFLCPGQWDLRVECGGGGFLHPGQWALGRLTKWVLCLGRLTKWEG